MSRWSKQVITVAGTIGIAMPLLLASPPASGAGPWYVAASGDDSNDCLSTLTPCATIDAALGKASAGDTIFVAVGTYTGTGLEVVLLDRDATLSGGWSGTFTSQTGTSTVDGEGARRGIFINGGVATNIDRFVIENGAGPTAQGGGGIFNDGGTLTLTNSTVTGSSSHAGTQGGGVLNRAGILHLNNSTVSNNSANAGAGIYADGLGTVVVNNSSIINNSSSGQGGGIYSLASNVNVNNSAVIDNSASVRGGGIFHSPPGMVTITNSTISGNTTPAPWEGGGLYHTGNDSVVILNSSTVSNNEAGNGGGIFTGGGVGSSVTLQNTILAGNLASTNPDCRALSSTPTSSAGFNLIGDTTGCVFTPGVGDLINIDPLLGPLQDNGGSTGTQALLIGSPAIDAGDPVCTDDLGNPILTDQRGAPRPVDGDHDGFIACDIGAFEHRAGPVLMISGVCPGAVTIGISGATADGPVAILGAVGEGMFTVPAGPCAGTELDLANPSLLASVTAGPDGQFLATPTVQAGACGRFLQAADVTTCVPSNTAQLP